MDSLRDVGIVCPDEGVAEIIGVFVEDVVDDFIAKHPQILDREDSRSARYPSSTPIRVS